MLLVAMAQSSSDNNATSYVDNVVFYIMVPIGHNQRRRYVSSSLQGGGTGGEFAVYEYLV